MNRSEYKEMLLNGIGQDGEEFVLRALQEECAELVVAINHYFRGKCNTTNLIEEMADVKIMLDMGKLTVSSDPDFDDWVKVKSNRLYKRITWRRNGSAHSQESIKT